MQRDFCHGLLRHGLGGRFGFGRRRPRVCGPEMTAADVAHPELIRCPGHPGSGIAHLHLGAAALAADVEGDVGHASGDSITLSL